jgi:hypothetical protein
MSKTNRYFPPDLIGWHSHRYWNNPWLKKVKKLLKSKRKTMKTKEVGNGSDYNKKASDPWFYD